MSVEELRAGGMEAVVSIVTPSGYEIWVVAGIPDHSQATHKAAGSWVRSDGSVEPYGDGHTSGLIEAYEQHIEISGDGRTYEEFSDDEVESVQEEALDQWWAAVDDMIECAHCGGVVDEPVMVGLSPTCDDQCAGALEGES